MWTSFWIGVDASGNTCLDYDFANTQYNDQKFCAVSNRGNGYCHARVNNGWKVFENKLSKNDCIVMILDTDFERRSFALGCKINYDDEEYRIYTDDMDVEYNLAISISNDPGNDEIELIEFETFQ